MLILKRTVKADIQRVFKFFYICINYYYEPNQPVMNRLFFNRFRMLLMFLAIFSSVSFSQFDNVDFLKSIPADGAKFLEAYFTPWANAFGAGLNGSWYNTAKPHKLGGFDITTGINVGFVPTADQTFDLSKLGLSSGISGTTGTTSTIAGPDKQGPALTFSQSGITLASFNAPPGTNWRYIPVPTAQIGIGLPLGTEIKGRFIPKIPIKGGDVMLWGIGLMHSIMQYIPGNELLPVDASIFAGYTRLTGNVPVSLQPETIGTHPPNYSAPYSATFTDQKFTATVEALNISAIASVNLPVISFYGGLGYNKTKTLLELTGNYPTPTLVTPGMYAEYNNTGVKKGTDFPKMDIENFSGLRANIGFRLKFAVITIHADYTRAQYNVLSTGLGISFR
jgi:hypothetical protein